MVLRVSEFLPQPRHWLLSPTPWATGTCHDSGPGRCPNKQVAPAVQALTQPSGLVSFTSPAFGRLELPGRVRSANMGLMRRGELEGWNEPRQESVDLLSPDSSLIACALPGRYLHLSQPGCVYDLLCGLSLLLCHCRWLPCSWVES